MRKPMLTADQLIDHMKSRGVKFTIVREDEARRQLQQNNVYFKLTSFCDNYPRTKNGQYADLEFAYLQELLRIDLELRNFLLDMALDVEHALKVAIIAEVERRKRTGQEDGYRIIRDFLLDEGNPSMTDRAGHIDYRNGNFVKKIRQNRNNPYCDVLIDEYEDEMPVWAYVELVTFAELQDLAEYYMQRTGWQPDIDMRSMDKVRQIRNACAHGNCVLNDLRPIRKPNGNADMPDHLIAYLLRAGIRKDECENLLANARINQIIHTFYTFDILVQDEYVRELRIGELDRLLNERIPRHGEYFANNDVLTQAYRWFARIVNSWQQSTKPAANFGSTPAKP